MNLHPKILFIITAILFLGMEGMSQNTSILVIDKDTKEPIPYANLCFESLESNLVTYSISSLDGIAENKAQNKCLLAISFIGYETIFDTILANENKIYVLNPDLFNLNQVVITATRTEKALKDVPSITQVVLSTEIESRGITDISTVLEDDVPGVEFHQSGFGSNIKMQGLDATYVLFLVDGERMAGETEGNIDYARLNMSDVERVEIVKGASSALYGSQAMGGVINIITKKPRDKVEFSIGGKYQQNNQINYPDLKNDDDSYTYRSNLDKPNLNLNATLGFNIKNFISKTSFVKKSTDAYELISSDSIRMDIIEYDTTLTELTANQIPGSSDFTISQLLEYQVNDKLRLRANGSYYIHDQYDFIPNKTFDQFEDYNYSLKAFYTYSEKGNLEMSYHDDIYNKFEYREITDVRDQEYSHHFYNPKVIVNQFIGESHQVTIGTEYLAENLATKMFSGLVDSLVTKTSATAIAYIQDDYKINSKLSVVAGLRFDYHTAFGAHLSPKLSVMYKLPPLTFRVNYAEGFRTPTLKELYMDWNLLNMFYLRGDENLLPETNNYISASAEYTKSKLNFSINIYKNWFKNRIGGYWSVAEDGKDVYNYANSGDSEMLGMEILLKYKITKHFYLSGGYSYLNDQESINNINTSAVAPHNGNVRLEYSLSKRVYDLKVNLSGKITGQKNYYEATSITINSVPLVGTYLASYSAYSLWKLSIAQNFHNGINVVLGVDNIFDYHAPIISFNTSLSPGRRFFISMNFKVDKLYREFSTLLTNRNKN